MAQVIARGEGRQLTLPGRSSLEILAGGRGSAQMTFRVVEIASPAAGAPRRGPHVHAGFEECIHVRSGEGLTETESGSYRLGAGDTIVVPAGELHVTHNTGDTPLVLMCFFPVPEIASATREFASWEEARSAR